jgi:hypothetical protein
VKALGLCERKKIEQIAVLSYQDESKDFKIYDAVENFAVDKTYFKGNVKVNKTPELCHSKT